MNTAVALTWHDIGKLEDIPARGARRVSVNDTTIAIFRTHEDRVFAIEDKCPHAGGPLSQGIVHGDCVTCPLHNWVISLKDGCAQGADAGHTRHYPVRNEEQRLLLGVDTP